MTALPPLDDFLSEYVECCPTCGSDSPEVRYVFAELGNGKEHACSDEWHDAPRDDA